MTFSIVAYDPKMGDLGVAVESKFPAVGAVVPYAQAGVGAIATQAYANPRYGPEGLALLREGRSADLPLRPATRVGKDDKDPTSTPRGIWYPNQRLQKLIDDDAFDNFDQNYREREELAWNRGASQQDTKELKEAYLDLEAFDSRLWLRLGKQQIVWGKTELFRTTDQFNPQDLALASLPGLEESRIPLWSLRGSWSFYDIGPLEDVRLEVATNYDEFMPADLGRGGEPYTLDLVSAGWFGFEVHGVLGLGLAGVRSPPNAWDSWQGIIDTALVETAG